MHRVVDVGKRIPKEDLEKLLIEAAGDVGLKARSQDKYETRYKLDSVEEVEEYVKTEIRLSRGFFPLMKVSLGNLSTRVFSVMTKDDCLPFGFGSKKTVENYLGAVSERVKAYRPAE